MSSDEEADDVRDLEFIRQQTLNRPKGDRMQVSAWDDDDDGIEENRNAKDPVEKAVMEAAEQGQLDKIKEHYASDPSVINCSDRDGYTPLHRACYGNHVEVVEFLLESGARIDAKTNDHWQPLHSACYWNNVDCASILLQHGADVNAKTKGDQTPLHLVSASSHNLPCLQLLLLNPDTDTQTKNSSGDIAYDIAKRSGKYYPLFEMTEPCFNEI